MPIRRGKRAIAIVALALAGCQPTTMSIPARTETQFLRLQTTGATAVLLRDLAAGYRSANPQIRFAFKQDTVSYAALVESVRDTSDPPYGLTNYLAAGADVWAAPIGEDQLALITHPANPHASLTLTELQAIFQGRVTNWQGLGGPDLPIEVISREPGAGTRLAFEATALNRQPVTRQARLAPGSRAMLEIVGNTSGAIGYISLGELDNSVHVVAVNGLLPTPGGPDNYPLRTTLYLVGREAPQAPYLAFFAWIQSAEGQAIVARRFTPLPPSQEFAPE